MPYLLFFFLLLHESTVNAEHNQTEDSAVPYNTKKPQHIASGTLLNHEQLSNNIACGGYLRAGFIQTDHDSASALGAETGCSLKINQNISAHTGLFASFDPGINRTNDEHIQGDFFNQKKDSYLIVGEAYLTLNYDKFNAILGRQRFNSPFMDEDDLRIIPNLFEAYLLDYHLTDEFIIGSGYIREAAGWENGANASQFVSIGEALGGHDNGAIVSWLDYDHDFFTNNTWFYYIPDHLTILYTELQYSQKLSDSLSYNIGFQYNWGSDLGNARLGHVDTHTFGVMAAITWHELTLTSAYNKNIGDTNALASIGGGPFFTSVEDQTLDAVEGSDNQAIMLGAEYNFVPELTVGVMAGKFNATKKSAYNKEELNLFLNYNWDDKVLAEVMYAVVNDLNKQPDMHQIRVILTYQY